MVGELEKEEVEDLLSGQYIGRLGCSKDNRPYIVPVTYYYDMPSSSIIGVSGEGKKVDMLRDNPKVCFEVEDIKDVFNWKSVVAWGEYEELSGADARNAIHQYVENLRPLVNTPEHPNVKFLHDISHSNIDHDKAPIIFRVKLKEKTGKFEKVG